GRGGKRPWVGKWGGGTTGAPERAGGGGVSGGGGAGPASNAPVPRYCCNGTSSASSHKIGACPSWICSCQVHAGVRIRSPSSIGQGLPSTIVIAPEPSSTKRNAFIV